MHVPITLAALALLTAVIVLLRICWSRLSFATHRFLIVLACTVLALYALGWVTHWSPTSPRLLAVVRWSAFAAYEFFLLLFTLFRPRLLTTIVATVLILPVLSASTLLPLSKLFQHFPETTVPLSGRLVSVRTIIDRSSYGTSAADLGVYYRTPWLPLLQHTLVETRFYETQCQAFASYAAIQSDPKAILFTCPPSPSQPSGVAVVERHLIH